MNAPSFFAELKRRNVYKVAAAYAVVAWLLLQALSILLPAFEAPSWVLRVFIAAIAAGFPLALIFAWAFELTPEGIKRTEEVPAEQSIARKTGRKLVVAEVVVAFLAGGLLAYQLTRQHASTRNDNKRVSATAPPNKSIAVLPFASLSEDKANAYFADGIQDEILTRLAKIGELKVISRTSTQQYQSKPGNLAEIAKQLGVAHILEGSVQKAGESVRVNVQLIKAEGDSHLWAETYDRKLTDIFAVESEIAEKIAKSLRGKLTPGEKQAVAAKPTDNPEAYDAFLRGLAIWNGLSVSPESLQKASAFFSRAVELDPNFAQAWAYLSLLETLSYAEYDPTAQRVAAAKRALDTAKQLQPDLGDGYFALGLYRYRIQRDYDGALEAFQEALERGVNRAMSLEFSGYVKRRQGKWDETLAMHRESIALDPRNTNILAERGGTFRALRRFAEAHSSLDQALEIVPGNAVLLAQKVGIYQAEGNFEAAEKLIERLPVQSIEPQVQGVRFMQSICSRRFAEAARELEALLLKRGSLPKNISATYRARLGAVKRWSGDTAGALQEFTRARAEFEALRERSDNGEGFLDAVLFVDGMLGDAAAVDLHAAKLQERIAKDAMSGPVSEQAIAQARAQLGQADAAVEILKRLLRKPGEDCITTALLRADPSWDPLRGDPRFQDLAGAKQ